MTDIKDSLQGLAQAHEQMSDAEREREETEMKVFELFLHVSEALGNERRRRELEGAETGTPEANTRTP